MSQPQKKQQAFADRYFRGATVRIARQQAKNLRTVIVDTPNLTDGCLHFDRSISIGSSGHAVLDDARKALSGQHTALAEAISSRDHTATSHHLPVKSITGSVAGSVWHHGETFKTYWVGKPTSIAHHADLTENERESFLMMVRKLAVHGSKVYAVAYGEHVTAPASYDEVSSTVVGLLVFHPILYPGTEAAVAGLHMRSMTIVYASRDSEHDVRLFARASCIDTSHTPIFVLRPGREVPLDYTLYAALDESKKQAIANHYPKDSVIILAEPLVDFWQTFTSFSH